MRVQSRKTSALEAVIQLSVGFLISGIINFYILPLYGYNISLFQSYQVTAIITTVSFLRLYTIRRVMENYK